VFEIKNSGRTALQFHNALHRVVSVGAGKVKQFESEEITPHLLRLFDKDPNFEVQAHTEQARAKLKEALQPQPRPQFRGVHGGGERSFEDTLLLEKNALRETVDEKEPKEPKAPVRVDRDKFITDPAPKLPPQTEPIEPGRSCSPRRRMARS
jgi:hypothetical protein